MNKGQLIAAVADGAHISRASAGRAVDTILEAVAASLAGGAPVALPGFGTFEVRARAARRGRNPRTGETIDIAAARLPAFKAGKALREAVNRQGP